MRRYLSHPGITSNGLGHQPIAYVGCGTCGDVFRMYRWPDRMPQCTEGHGPLEFCDVEDSDEDGNDW